MSLTLTATPETSPAGVPRVRLDVADVTASEATIYRIDPSGRRVPVRQANPMQVVGAGTVYDYEAPFDESISYEVEDGATTVASTLVARRNLFENPQVAVDAAKWGKWTGNASTVARMTGQTGWAFSVPTSFRLTWDAAQTGNGEGVYFAEFFGLTPGDPYAGLMQVRSNVSHPVYFVLEWYDETEALVSRSLSEVTLAANTVHTLTVTDVVPEGASRCWVGCYTQDGYFHAAGDYIEATNGHFEKTSATLVAGPSDPTGGVFSGSFGPGTYGADFTYEWEGTPNASTSIQRHPGKVLLSSNGQPWLIHPGKPEISVPLNALEWPTWKRPVERGVFAPIGRKYRVVVGAQRQSAEGDLTAYTSASAETDRMEAILDDGTTLLLKGTSRERAGNRWVSVGDVASQPGELDLRAFTVWSLPLVEVEAPVGIAVAAALYSDASSAFTTYSDAMNLAPTYADRTAHNY